jgi:hypothetical protein
MNVQRAYDHGPGGAVDLKVYSPKTGLTYAVHCTGGIPHVCRTAEGALITFSTGPSYWPGSAPPAGLTACDQNIARGPQTSCPFADAVFRAYVAAYRAGAGQRAQVNATSPDTGQRYVVGCASDGTVVRCTTAGGALVSFPLRAVQVY